MKPIATLGPQGTFSDLATNRFIDTSGQPYEVRYYDSIKKVLKAVGPYCPLGVIPIENFSEGFIPIVLDTLASRTLSIVDEISLPIEFSFVSRARHLHEIQKVFVQFAAKGQCEEFLSGLKEVQEVMTQSNIESLAVLRGEPTTSGAIVPSHAAHRQDFPLVIEHVHDFEHNQTRFAVISSEPPTEIWNRPHAAYKTSLVVFGERDYPGLLAGVLTSFSSRTINITSLVSRPNRAKFGQYNFFIDIAGHAEDPLITTALGEIDAQCSLKVLGSYPVARLK